MRFCVYLVGSLCVNYTRDTKRNGRGCLTSDRQNLDYDPKGLQRLAISKTNYSESMSPSAKSNFNQKSIKYIKKMISFFLLPFGRYKFVVFSLTLDFFKFLGAPQFFVNKLIWQPEFKSKNFVKICINSKSQQGLEYVYYTNSRDDLRYLCRFNFQDWEFVSRRIFSSIALDCDFVLDIGAYTGVYSIEAARVNNRLIVKSFEPNPEIIQNLQKNIEANNLKERIEIFPIALGQNIGASRLYLPHNDLASSSATLNPSASKFFEVKTSTLDDLFAIESVDLIKIDVEGFESEIFAGGKKVLERCKPIILAEALTQNELNRQQSILSGCGYLNPISVAPGSEGDNRNFIWCSKKDEQKVKSIIGESKREFVNHKDHVKTL
jgi:FkbM family methyltransferase